MDIDDTTIRLGDASVPLQLAALDGAVLAKIAADRADDLRRPLAFASLLALVVGVAGAGLPSQPAAACDTLAPFGASSPLMPSTLLGEAP